MQSQALWWGWKARRKMSDADLLAQTNGDWQTMDSLLAHLAGRPASSFVLPHTSPKVTFALLSRYYPEYVSAVLAAADAVCRNEVALLGRVFHYPGGIDWHREPVTGLRWPLWHRGRIGPYLYSPGRTADLILFWELNRHQHFITLGIAYWLTGDKRYVDAFCAQVGSWIETNPLQHGLNWYFPLEVSIRLLAWTTAFQFFRDSSEFRERVGNAFLKSLWQQADFLSGHLQTTRNDVPNNHMMAELTGLVIVGTAFPEFRSAARWRETGLSLLAEQAVAQTHPDGVNKEQATGYHRFIAELLFLVVARGRQGSLPREQVLEDTLEHMFEYMCFTMTPAGKAPLWGDSDYGRALGLGLNKDFWDFRPLLSSGAALFGRTDWKFAAGRFDEEAFLILGADGLDLWQKLDGHPPEQTSRAFPQAGLYIIRDGWASDTDAAFFRCGPFGLGGEGHCAHAHCDLLSFVLWINGLPLLVDSGTYIYSGPERDSFRLTAAHNTVMIDGREQASPMPYFNWLQVPKAKCIGWTGKSIRAASSYSGHVEHVRELAHQQPGEWELTDKFTGHSEHEVEWFFHFAPGLELHLNEGEHTLTVLKEGQTLVIARIPGNGTRCQLRDSWWSYQYGVKEPNRGLYGQWKGTLRDGGASFQWLFQLNKESTLPTGGR